MTDNFILEKAGSEHCKISRGKLSYHCDAWSWRDKTQQTWMATLCFYMFVFIFGWITRGRVAYSCNYRHYVIQCPVSHLAWWVSGDRTTIDHLCAAIEFHVHYTTPFVPAAKYYSDNSHAKAVVKSMYTTWNEYIKDGLLFWCVWNCCTHAQNAQKVTRNILSHKSF